MDAISTHAGELVATAPRGFVPGAVLDELYLLARADVCGLCRDDFAAILRALGERLNFGAGDELPAEAQRVAFLRALHLEDLALAQACALGIEQAWERFVAAYRESLLRAAVAIAGSATDGHELAASLYGDLFGMKEREGVRRSPLASYSGRGSLMGWLRTTLAQRHVDRHRRTYRETPLDTLEVPAQPPEEAKPYAGALVPALDRTLAEIAPEDRFLLVSYFLDRRTLAEIARILRVHEATISRRIRRLTGELRGQLLRHLQAGGLSRRAAEEALGTDPRDVEVNLRAMLQGSQQEAFQDSRRSE